MSKAYRQRSSAVTRKSQYSKTQLEGSFCRYAHRICMQDKLDGFDFCIDHILQDKNAPYKPCNFVSAKSGGKCTKAAPKADKKDGYCKQHTRKASVLRYKTSLKSKPKDPAQLILDELDYYATGSTKDFPTSPVSSINKLLDYGSGSDSDFEPTQLDQTYQGDQDSDADSVDSEPEDSLKYAEVYTAEEVSLITRDKLIRLQSLYINQFKRLQHLMREKRRQFLSSLKKEMPIYGPNLGRTTDGKERKRLKKLKAMVSYRKRKGQCALLHRKSKTRRIQVTADYHGPVKESKLPVCSFLKGQQKCDKPCVPLVKFCMEHVFLDPRQVLYKHCSKASGVCRRAAIPYYKGFTCVLHQEVPPYTPRLWKHTRLQKKREAAPTPFSLFNDSSILSCLEPMDTSIPVQFTPPDHLSLPSTSKAATIGTYRQGSTAQQQVTPSTSASSYARQLKISGQSSAVVPPLAGTTTPAQVSSEQKLEESSDSALGGVAMATDGLATKNAGQNQPSCKSAGEEQSKLHRQADVEGSGPLKKRQGNTEEMESVIDVTGMSNELVADRSIL